MKAFCHVVTGEEMQRYDRNTIAELGIPALVLMEQAAMAVVTEIIRLFPEGKERILVLVGKGNNGADGMAVARLLRDRDYQADVYPVFEIKESNSQDDLPGYQYGMLKRLEIPIVTNCGEDAYDVVVDAIFGVGLKRELSEELCRLLQTINSWDAYRLAVDVPTGICSDTGKVLGCGFQADSTVTFGFLKLGLCLDPGRQFAGRVTVGKIGIHSAAFMGKPPLWKTWTADPAELMPTRPVWGHKGSFGKVLIVGGSAAICGAPYLSALGAFRTGSGMVKIWTHENQRQSLSTLIPEAFIDTDPVEEKTALQMKAAADWADAVIFGPGIGTDERAIRLLDAVLDETRLPLVIDADGLNLLASTFLGEKLIRMQADERNKRDLILTPHLLELTRLAKLSIDRVKDRREGVLEATADWYRGVVVQKDSRTLVWDTEEKGYVNLCGNSGMATAGSGDVLTGMIGSLLGQGLTAFHAAALGVYLHGKAGDMAAKRRGEYSLLASDIAEAIPELLNKN